MPPSPCSRSRGSGTWRETSARLWKPTEHEDQDQVDSSLIVRCLAISEGGTMFGLTRAFPSGAVVAGKTEFVDQGKLVKDIDSLTTAP
ncbi:unnamed protein product [Symbiodinium sp. CCMP2592]|nr:unnamed protein product [Symbiodinium sp. CCMP2592]